MNEFIGFPVLTAFYFLVVAIWTVFCDWKANSKKETITVGDAAKWSGYYVLVACMFALILWLGHGWNAAAAFTTGYVLEKVLSIDNLIVFAAIFSYFGIHGRQQYQILKWGILGAIVFRLLFVLIGTAALWLFGGWMELLFAILVGWTAWKMMDVAPSETEFSEPWFTRLARKHFPAYGKIALCLITIECSDIIFAFDSVPTVIAVTRDPFLVYTSMIFAILGLRSMYFLLAAVKDRLHYVETAVICILFFIAIKLSIHAILGVKINPLISFAIVMSALTAGALASWLFPKNIASKTS